MKKPTLISVVLAAALFPGCVDHNYDLDKMGTDARILQNLEFPVGSFKEFQLTDLLDIEGASLTKTGQDVYRLHAYSLIQGLDFELVDGWTFREAELHMTILNSLPMDIDLSVAIYDEFGNTLDGLYARFADGQKGVLQSGVYGSPSANEIVLNLTCEAGYGNYIPLLEFTLDGMTDEAHAGRAPESREGIKLTNVYLKIPEGISGSF